MNIQKHVGNLMNIHNIYDYVTDDLNIHCYTAVIWISMERHGYINIMSTRHGWPEYSWVHVTGDMDIHECTSRVTEYSWIQIMGDMIFISHVTGVWIFMSTRHGWHGYS